MSYVSIIKERARVVLKLKVDNLRCMGKMTEKELRVHKSQVHYLSHKKDSFFAEQYYYFNKLENKIILVNKYQASEYEYTAMGGINHGRQQFKSVTRWKIIECELDKIILKPVFKNIEEELSYKEIKQYLVSKILCNVDYTIHDSDKITILELLGV